ncbi:MAG: phytochelatin synthase family protein [Halioglobus sp.]
MKIQLKKLLSIIFLTMICSAQAGAGPSGELIYLTSAPGQKLFMDSEIQGDYFSLATYLEFEQVLTFCGPASMATVLNSLEVPRPSPKRLYPYKLFTQNLLFNEQNQKVKAYAKVEKVGLLLPEVAEFLNNLGVTASFHHADEFSVDWLRNTLIAALADSRQRVIVNYSRRPLGQNGDGHLSPAAAYDEDSDRVLILDVAKYKYPPVWLTVEKLHIAMLAKDSESNRSRGLVLVKQ